MEEQIPNIFEIATKELSQDAFITWLIKWADDSFKSRNENLHSIAKFFLKRIFDLQKINLSEEIVSVKAGRQWENIDIWIDVNNKYSIIIEDKTNTGQHSGQLERYKKTASEWCCKNNYKHPICIYLKTGNESRHKIKEIENIGYSVITRKDIISILEKELINNDIFTDFLSNLKRIDMSFDSWKNKKIGKWEWNEWQGFFQALDEKVHLIDWNYVPNANGGFLNAVINWEYKDSFPFYIQLEENKLAFKISTHPDDISESISSSLRRREIRNKFYMLIIEKALLSEFKEITKPTRFGNGNYMTVAIVEQDDWLGKKDELVNIDKVVQNIEKYKEFQLSIINNECPIFE